MNRIFALSLLIIITCSCQAQVSWLPGYLYRKPITFDKSMVSGNAKTLSNFIVQLQIEHSDFIHILNAFDQKILNPNAYDIAFTTIESPTNPLKFELETYSSAIGKLICWVKVPALYTKVESTFKTTIYLYYGSTKLYNPLTVDIWKSDYEQVDHLDHGDEGIISTALRFNGVDDYIEKPATAAINYSVSAWIKPEEIGTDQVIFSNDSAQVGYLFKIDSIGKLVFEVSSGPALGRKRYKSRVLLSAGQWYHFSISVLAAGNYHSILMYINGVADVSLTEGMNIYSSKSRIAIGRSQQGDRYFKGLIDEWRLGSPLPLFFLETEYRNQRNPLAFSTLGAEQQNPGLIFFHTFTGLHSTSWNNSQNWLPYGVPESDQSVRIKEGKQLNVPANIVINQLLLEKAAIVNLLANASVNNRVILEGGAVLTGEVGSRLQLRGDLENDGNIVFDKANATLQIYGSRNAIVFKGPGNIRARRLEIDLPTLNAVINLKTPLQLTSSLQIFNGALNSGGYVQLLSLAGKTAMVYPLGRESAIIGDVHVQYQVNGSFPAPSSGRGWRLLSSPVYQVQTGTAAEYDLKNLQQSIFVTGAGGTDRGFDASPNNGATIYTHNQAMAGTLSQKYIPITHIDEKLQLGTGYFVFSRGGRHVPNAFQQQIVSRPFSNAEPYILTYIGSLFKGSLTVQVFNKDEGNEGDGFNLLGNPYAAPLRWGSLIKENVGPNIWMFDPLNNSYIVSNDPETIIPTGAGFFIKVNPGAQSGTVRFDEQSKVLIP